MKSFKRIVSFLGGPSLPAQKVTMKYRKLKPVIWTAMNAGGIQTRFFYIYGTVV